MKIKVSPSDPTTIEISPTENPNYDVAMTVRNEYMDATLLFTVDDVKALIAQFQKYIEANHEI